MLFMANSNFHYLEKEFTILFNIGQAAEFNLHSDPVTCLFKLRQFGEKAHRMNRYMFYPLIFISECYNHFKLKIINQIR